MKTLLAFLASLLSLSAFGAGAPYLPVFNSAQVANPNLNTTSTVSTIVFNVSNPPVVGTYTYPFVTTLNSNASFVIQDSYGNNIMGARADFYTLLGKGEWECRFGSKGQPLTDWQVDMAGSGGDAAITINGVAGSGFRFNLGLSPLLNPLMQFQMLQTNTVYKDNITPSIDMIDDGGRHTMVDIAGVSSSLQSLIAGPAAGSGATVTTDDRNQSDISANLVLTTGTGTTAGTILIYGQECLRTNLGYAVLTTNKPVFSPVNINAVGVSSAVYITGSTTNWILATTAPLPVSTTFVWNFFNCR